MIKKIYLLLLSVILFLPFNSFAEKAKLETIDENQDIISEADLKILKLQTRIQDLQIEVNNLKSKFEQLEFLQKKLLQARGEATGDTDLFMQKTKDAEYNYAYNQLINNKLSKAERAFDLYIEKYPRDKKIGEIYFWKGEISYKREEYTDSLEYYLTSYQKYPTNSRNTDSLFKMSLVLGFLGKTKDACEGFNLITDSKLPVDPGLRERALEEAVHFGCIN